MVEDKEKEGIEDSGDHGPIESQKILFSLEFESNHN